MVNFKQLLEKATSSDLSEPDWETILEIVEEIKGKNTSPKNAVKEFRKRLLDNNSNTVYHTLLVLDSVVKNCSSDVHSEILTHEFLQIMKTVVTSSSSGEKAVDKVLEMIGEWKVAFGQQSGFKAVNEIFSDLQREGYHIPETELGSAAFMKKAPDWTLGERCYMCRTEFHRFKGAFRHHCRNCGKSVCAQCSGKRLALPHYGIDQPTRVCDICYKKHDKPGALESAGDSNNSDLPVEYLQSSLAQESQQPSSSSGAQDSELQMKEDDDLQLAIAMSLNEQENKQKAKKKSSSSAAVHGPSPTPPPPQSAAPSAPPPSSSTLYATIMHDPTPSSTGPAPSSYGGGGGQSEPESDPNLARYLDRGYWEQRREQQAGGGGGGGSSGVEGRKSPSTAASGVGPEAVVLSQGTSGSPLAETVRKTIEMFLQRMHEVSGAGGSIATDPVVLSLYQNLNALQPQLLQQIDEVQQKKAKQEAVLNKLNEAKEARVTLNRMRREHQEKVRQQEKEQALLARMQMEQKLALLRQQKQEQLDFEKSLQQQRLETLQSQRSEYEQRIQAQREKERMLLIAQEKQVLQQQFGGNGGVAHPPPPSVMAQPAPPTSVVGGAHPYMAPPPTTSSYNPTSLQLQSLSLHDPTQAGPLPSKLDHTMGLDQSVAGAPPPPPYQPSSFHQPPPPPQSLSALPTDNMAAVSVGYSTGGGSYQQQQPLSSLQPSTFTQPQHQHVGMSTINPPSSMASLQPPAQMNGQPHSLESLLSVPQMGSGGGQPSSLPAQLSSGAGAPTSESFQPYQPQQQPQPGGGGGFGAPPPSLGGPPPPQPSLPPAPNTGMMAPPGGYQQPGVGGGAYSGQPPPPANLPPPGVTGSFQPPPSLSQQPQQFGAPPPSMQMHAPVGGGGFIPNGAHHQGQAPPQPHPPHVGRQESQPPLISFD